MYQVEFSDEALRQSTALPIEAVSSFLEVHALLSVAPWSGKSLNEDNPDANILSVDFGPQKQGMVVYMVLDYRRHVEVLRITWVEL